MLLKPEKAYSPEHNAKLESQQRHLQARNTQCESKSFTPQMFSGNISPMNGNFKLKFQTPIASSYLASMQN